jgi:hypothetical protein
MSMKRVLAGALSGALIMATSGCASIGASQAQAAVPSEIQPAQITPEYLQDLVAPIALYPDELVAEVLAASTYPTEIVEADRWLQQHSGLKGAQLAGEVDKESWDPSVKALTQFPSVLANMDKNLSWTSTLGDAYFNDQQDVMNAIQAMRKRAQGAGTLKTTAQQKVTAEDETIVIEPANPQVVYVPTYDPWIVYGAPLAVYPGYVAGPWVGGPVLLFDTGFPIWWGFDSDWGWHAWHPDWRHRHVVWNHHPFVSHSPTFIHHAEEFRPGGGFRGENGFRGRGDRPETSDHRADRGFVAPESRPGVFHGVEHGGLANLHSFRGQSSFGGGTHAGGFAGGMHGGFGGGMRGGFGSGGMHGGGGGHR